jgi:hypothetical protein
MKHCFTLLATSIDKTGDYSALKILILFMKDHYTLEKFVSLDGQQSLISFRGPLIAL